MIRFFLLLIPILGFSIAGSVRAQESPQTDVTVQDARVAGDRRRTRFIADLSAKVPISVFTLADPYRVIIDLPEIAFALPAESGARGRGLISAYRFGRFAPGKSRIVIDSVGPVRVNSAFVLDPVAGQPARLVIDLLPTDRAAFLRAVSLSRPPETPQPAPASPTVTDRPTVVIDPGHGGIDPGTLGTGGVAEKTLMLEMAKILKGNLERSGRIRVLLTREDDRFVPLAERVRLARASHAALFLSLHADSIDTASVRGATVYILSETATDSRAAALAEKENRADIAAGFDLPGPDDIVSDILTDLTRRETHNHSAAVAKAVIETLKGTARLNKNPFRAAGFRVLRAPDVPSILLELGYLSSQDDARLLASAEWRERTAAALAEAVETVVSRQTAHIR